MELTTLLNKLYFGLLCDNSVIRCCDTNNKFQCYVTIWRRLGEVENTQWCAQTFLQVTKLIFIQNIIHFQYFIQSFAIFFLTKIY